MAWNVSPTWMQPKPPAPPVPPAQDPRMPVPGAVQPLAPGQTPRAPMASTGAAGDPYRGITPPPGGSGYIPASAYGTPQQQQQAAASAGAAGQLAGTNAANTNPDAMARRAAISSAGGGGGGGAGGAGGGGPGSTTGSESGPGILESWFNQRANGTDPAFEYMSKRGMTDLGNQYAAGGNFNSGAARQGESDFMANLTSQRMGQLDSLAGGASGEHQGRVNSMFNQGLGLANGQAGTAGKYDIGAADAMTQGNLGSLMMMLNKAGVDQKSNDAANNSIMKLLSLFA